MHLRMRTNRRKPPKPGERMAELLRWLEQHRPLFFSQITSLSDRDLVKRLNQMTGVTVDTGRMLPDDAAYHWLKAFKLSSAEAD